MYRLIIFLLGIFSAFGVCAQQPIGNYKSGFSKKGNEYSFSSTNGDVKIEFCAADIVRIRAAWDRRFEANEPWMVVKYEWQPVAVVATENKDHFLLKTTKLQLKIFKSPFRIDIFSADGKLLSSEKLNSLSQHADTISCTKQLLPNEHFFGFGERMDFVDQRSKKIKLNVGRGKGLPHMVGAYNILEANYCPIPFFMSTQGYGIFLHNAFPTTWDMGTSGNDQYSFSAAGGEMDYYFFYGPSFPDILNSYTTVTGKAPLMPIFALGLQVGTYAGGTWGYEQLTSDAYVIALARKLRALGIPVDILHLDSVWRIFGKNGGKGATSFEWRETFKDPKGMFDSLYAMNYKMVGMHLRPRFDNGNYLNLLDTARQLGFTYPEKGSPGEFVNFFDQKAIDWWWEHGVKRIAAVGARFLKTDEGSAFGALANESDKVGPTGKDVAKLHNIFPLAYAKAPYEKFQAYNGMRGMNNTREGYAGIQRYPFIFAGDWPSEWQYFAPVIKAGLNIGLSGVGNWAHCMGGFEHVADPELYIRWCQFGMMSPVAHLFGMEHPTYKEPWAYGDEALHSFRKYDSLRYRLIPYLYSHSWQMYKTGMPLMRALVLDYQNDENVYDIADQYLFGSSLMVCPVTTKGAQTRSVYLPEGLWYDYWTGKQYNGRQYIHVLTPLDVLPMFVKAGSIIPMQPAMAWLGEKPVDIITLDIFPSKNGSFELYEDDGQTLQYQQGNYAITRMNITDEKSSIIVNISKPQGKFVPAVHRYLAKVHMDAAPVRVTENDKAIQALGSKEQLDTQAGWFFDAQEKLCWVKTGPANTADDVARIAYNKIVIFKN
jgi:alpha-glucosidase